MFFRKIINILNIVRIFHTSDGKEKLFLEGDHEKTEDLDFFALAVIFLRTKFSDILFVY